MRNPAFVLRYEERKGVPTLVVSGELDLETAPKARQLLEEVLKSSPRDLAFDFSELRYLDSTGLGIILLARRQVPGKMVVISSMPGVRKALLLSGLDELVQVEGDRSEAGGRERAQQRRS